MFNWFKKKKSNPESEFQSESSKSYDFKWYEIGEGNPFNKKVLDIRSYTGTMLAFTKEKKVAEKYNAMRQSNGEYLINQQILNSVDSTTDLKYPHNGDELNGIVFKADSMDCKWDIYAFENTFYFSRSWNGDLTYKAKFKIDSDSIEITEIEHSNEIEQNMALSDIHYLIKTHALNQPIPHNVPSELKTEMEIAQWSFSKFGNRAYYATYENTFDTVVTLKK
ncbi:hypothetical protein [Aquimarina sp. RZ0]|uniref:hypothetical protein n=1 Tax=Aquimarina sp. RZ0 TaxID=2607730 RepID=UPI0011F0B56A|nr:hypothetical protein [Aquimarina sp. RZ0]KAA1245791.1 hypothetical protein F0000_10340 [Aquimarina sp. RZ0]